MRIKNLTFLFLLFITCLSLSGCFERVQANTHVLTTDDCGANWAVIQTGQPVSKKTFERCGYNTTLPNWPMPGDLAFKAGFSRGVLATIRLSYVYQIVDPIKYLKNAPYLAATGAGMDLSSDKATAKFDQAESLIGDKIIRDITNEITEKLSLVDVSPSFVEEEIQKKASLKFAERGLSLFSISLVIDNDEQTRLALDSITALKIYQSVDEAEMGRRVIVARAGAPKIELKQDQK